MENAVRVNREEWKIPFERWKNVVLREALSRMPVRIFVEVEGKEKIMVFSPEDAKVVEREMFTEPYEGMDDDAHKDVRGFSEMVRRGDVMDVGPGGTYWDKEVRWGVVKRHGEIVWLDKGEEGEVRTVLNEAAKIVTAVDKQNKLKELDYLQNNPVFNELHEKVMGYKPF